MQTLRIASMPPRPRWGPPPRSETLGVGQGVVSKSVRIGSSASEYNLSCRSRCRRTSSMRLPRGTRVSGRSSGIPPPTLSSKSRNTLVFLGEREQLEPFLRDHLLVAGDEASFPRAACAWRSHRPRRRRRCTRPRPRFSGSFSITEKFRTTLSAKAGRCSPAAPGCISAPTVRRRPFQLRAFSRKMISTPPPTIPQPSNAAFFMFCILL